MHRLASSAVLAGDTSAVALAWLRCPGGARRGGSLLGRRPAGDPGAPRPAASLGAYRDSDELLTVDDPLLERHASGRTGPLVQVRPSDDDCTTSSPLTHVRPATPAQWYPGHIARAERQLKEQLRLVDVVLDVRASPH